MAIKAEENRRIVENTLRNEIAFCVKNSLEKIFNKEITIETK
jgi:hypothetical protein